MNVIRLAIYSHIKMGVISISVDICNERIDIVTMLIFPTKYDHID